MKNFILKAVSGFYKIVFGKIEIIGLENIPKDKTFLVAPNHMSNFDPPLIAAFLPVCMTYMAKASLFKVPIVSQVIRAFGAFPVNRSGDIGAIRTAMKLMQDGKNLVVFPEGTRVRTRGTLGEGKHGAVMIAAKAGCGIIPVGIETSYKFRKGITIRIGTYIDLAEYKGKRLAVEELENLTNGLLMENIAELAGAKMYGN